MKMICKKCNADIETDAKIFTCQNCGESYDLNLKSEHYDIKLLNGLKISDLNYNAIKDGICKGKFLSVDFITYQGVPWIRIKDSEFGEFIPFFKEISQKTVAKKRNWFYLFIVSFMANIIMLIAIYFLTQR